VCINIPERRRLPPDAPVASGEKWLIVYGMGLTLDKIASVLEHGWSGGTHPSPGIATCALPLISCLCSIHGKHVERPRYRFLCLFHCVLVLAYGWKWRGGSCDFSVWCSVAIPEVNGVYWLGSFVTDRAHRLAFVVLSNNVLVL